MVFEMKPSDSSLSSARPFLKMPVEGESERESAFIALECLLASGRITREEFYRAVEKLPFG